jgi:hypothetical protein
MADKVIEIWMKIGGAVGIQPKASGLEAGGLDE